MQLYAALCGMPQPVSRTVLNGLAILLRPSLTTHCGPPQCGSRADARATAVGRPAAFAVVLKLFWYQPDRGPAGFLNFFYRLFIPPLGRKRTAADAPGRGLVPLPAPAPASPTRRAVARKVTVNAVLFFTPRRNAALAAPGLVRQVHLTASIWWNSNWFV
jgi:hypothetical protein